MVILGWMNTKPILSGGSSGPLFPYINLYLTQLKEQGYAAGSFYEQIHVLKACDRWLKETGRDVRDLDESITRECLRRVIKGGYGKNAGRQRCDGCLRCSAGLELHQKLKQCVQGHLSN